MPKRLKVLMVVFGLLACTNSINGVLIAYHQTASNWLARAIVSLVVAAAFLAAAGLIRSKRSEAKWFPAALVGLIQIILNGPKIYSFCTLIAHRDARLAPNFWVQSVYAGVYLLILVGCPLIVHALIASKKSTNWLNGQKT